MSLHLSLSSLREDRGTYTSDLKVPSIPVPMTFVNGTEVRIALASDERPMLLLPVSTEELRNKLPEAGGLSMEFTRYRGTSSSSGYFLQVCSIDSQLESVFLDLLENICSRIQKGQGSYASLVAAIDEFRHLLNKIRLPVDRNRIIGLVGELLFLRQSLACNPAAVSYWTGPQKARRDFLFPSVAIEVKTSEQSTGKNVFIHSLAQLDNDDADDLVLMYYRVEEHPGKGQTAGDLVQNIRETLATTELFDEKLEAVGFSSSTADSWNIFRWLQLEAQAFKVMDGFPRITARSFCNGPPSGISHVSYQLDLGLAQKYAIPAKTLKAKMKQ